MVRCNQSEHSVWTIPTNESAPLCLPPTMVVVTKYWSHSTRADSSLLLRSPVVQARNVSNPKKHGDVDGTNAVRVVIAVSKYVKTNFEKVKIRFL